MIERFRLWLRKWLGIDDEHRQVSDFADHVGEQVRRIYKLAVDIAEERGRRSSLELNMFTAGCRLEKIEAELARLAIAQYVPPQQEEPKPKVIQTRTMREFNAILEQEFEEV